MITFRASEDVLAQVLHRDLEPDRWDGHPHVSLVAFDFRNTRVKGCRFPSLSDFAEVNLRTYVRHGEERGVLFIRELVPHHLIALVARLRYNEPYRTLRMESRTRADHDAVTVTHRFGSYGVRVTGSAASHVPLESSAEHHFIEHPLGFGVRRNGRLLRYRVEHPRWPVRHIQEMAYEIDFRSLYGPRWGFLDDQEPVSVIFAVGSDVEVFPPRPA